MSDAAVFDPLAQFRHSHDHGAAAASHETRTRWVVALTFAMDALPVAALGLVVNLVSVKLLHTDGHPQDLYDGPHDHEHAHASRHGPDHNLRAAYFHVLADTLTSVLAILALLGGRYFGWTFLDAAMGVVGGLVIARWSYGLCRQAAKQLLDMVPSEELARRIRERIESEFAGASVVDLHLWDIGPSARACIVSVAAASPRAPTTYRDALASIASLQHVTVEVHPLSLGGARAAS